MRRRDPAETADGHLRAGRIAQARAIYEGLRRDEPTHVRALCGLGTIALRGGEFARALDLIGSAAAIAPGDGVALGNLGVVYLARNQLPEAEDCLRRAIHLDPERAELRANLANVLLAGGDGERALEAQRHAVRLAPDSVTQRFNLANVLVSTGQPEAAAETYEAALEIEPTHAGALNNLSVLRKRERRLQEAEALLDEAGLSDPLSPDVLANRADVLLKLGRRDEALAAMRRAASLAPGNPRLRASLGIMLLEIGRLDEAGKALAAAMRGAPKDAGIALALARLLRRRDRLDAAQTAADRAGELSSGPSPAGALSVELLLMRGRYAEAWERLDAHAQGRSPQFAEPYPDRDVDLSGSIVRLLAVDGAASLFAARFVPELAARGAAPRVLCPPVLAPLLATVPGVVEVLPRENLDLSLLADDRQPTLTMDSLPHRLRATPERSAPVPFFVLPAHDDPDPAGARPRRVGLWWEGPGPGDALPAALAGVDGVTLVSLQSGSARTGARTLLARSGVVDRGGAIGDFLDLAVAVRGIDVMIAPDGPVAHLAGGLGVETWVMVGRDGSWYWPHTTLPSPWYPSSRSFRQSADGTWTSALQALRAALCESGAAAADRSRLEAPA